MWNADDFCKLTCQSGIRGDQGFPSRTPVAGEEVVDEAAGLGDEHEARGAVPGIDVQLA